MFLKMNVHILYAFSLKKKLKKKEIKKAFNDRITLKFVIIWEQAKLCQVNRTISNCSKGSLMLKFSILFRWSKL